MRKLLMVAYVLAVSLPLLLGTACTASGQEPTVALPPIATPTEAGEIASSNRDAGAVPESELRRITVEELKGKIDQGMDVTIVDVRSKAAFDESHIVDSISMPLEVLEERYQELRKESEIVTICT